MTETIEQIAGGRVIGGVNEGAAQQMNMGAGDQIAAIRARFEPLTRNGTRYEIFADRDGYLYGRVLTDYLPSQGYVWKLDGSAMNFKELDLIPRDTTRELIEEAKAYVAADYGEHAFTLSTHVKKIISNLLGIIEQKESGK